MSCYRKGSCGPYEMYSCLECPASKPEYANRYTNQKVVAADVIQIVHGEWIKDTTFDLCGIDYYKCSVCSKEQQIKYPYCQSAELKWTNKRGVRTRATKGEISVIYVTGDTHGTIDIHKLNSKNFPEGRTLTKDDYVIICGDFGFVWNGGAEDQWWLNWLNNKPWTTLFVDGNHENHDMLEQMEVTEWHGGKVHKINESVIHLMRGQVYEINGKKWFTFGGAKSQDQMIRVEGKDWWAGEMASEEEYEEAVRNLAAVGWTVDYVVTHCAPTRTMNDLGFWWYQPDRMTNFLDYSILERLKFSCWFFGHYHRDAIVSQGVDGERIMFALYRARLSIK